MIFGVFTGFQLVISTFKYCSHEMNIYCSFYIFKVFKNLTVMKFFIINHTRNEEVLLTTRTVANMALN